MRVAKHELWGITPTVVVMINSAGLHDLGPQYTVPLNDQSWMIVRFMGAYSYS